MTGKASEPAAGFQNQFRSVPRMADLSPGRLLMRQTACARRFLPAMIGGGTWEGAHARHEAAGVRQPARRRGGGVAARGASAARRCRWSGFFAAVRRELNAHLVTAFRQGLGERLHRGSNVRSNIAGRTVDRSGCRNWRPIWFANRWPSSPRRGSTGRGGSRQNPQPRPFQSCSAPAATRSDGLVASLNRPGGNVTGVSFHERELGTKRVGLLQRACAAGRGAIAVLVNPNNPLAEA